ncbi:major tail protein [Clostridium perfringens]|uniref:major tail protein n=1 Tax=Clostridium perfringens TaxID=1502 RepID=UPI000D710CCE|nr:major tail protein [Clostridium perfringens]PWW86425.1 hypothetical protein CYK81_09195 [Clostridium perfringens]
MARSGLVGLKDIHVGIYKGDGIAYEGVTVLPGALTAKITVNETSESFYADDALIEVVNGLEGIELEFELAGLSTKEKALLLGQKITNGILEESIADIGSRPYIGMTFSAELSNGGQRLVSIPKIKFSPNEDEYSTKQDKIEKTPAKLKGTAVPLDSGTYKITADIKVNKEDSTAWNGSKVEEDGTIIIAKTARESFLKKIPQTTEEASTELKKGGE